MIGCACFGVFEIVITLAALCTFAFGLTKKKTSRVNN